MLQRIRTIKLSLIHLSTFDFKLKSNAINKKHTLYN